MVRIHSGLPSNSDLRLSAVPALTTQSIKKTSVGLVFLATLYFIVFSPAVSAQESPEPAALRYDFTPFVGYRTSMSFPIEPHVTGMNPRVIVDASPSYGMSFGLRLPEREEDLVELRWARQDSYIHSEGITPEPLLQRILLDQVQGDFSHEPLIEDWPWWAKPYALASVGVTHISGGSIISFTRFSFGIGGGIRLYTSRHIGFKIQAEWSPVFADPHIAFVCGGGCIVHVGGTLASQGEIVAGPLFRF